MERKMRTTQRPTPGDSSTVFIVRNATLFKSAVLLGDRMEGKVEVRSGIEEGDRIVLNPTRTLKEGEQVEVME